MQKATLTNSKYTLGYETSLNNDSMVGFLLIGAPITHQIMHKLHFTSQSEFQSSS